MTAHDAARPIDLRLSRTDLDVVRVALRHLLASEDDPDTIEVIKALLARLPQPEDED